MIDLVILFASHCLADHPLQGDFISKWKGKSFYILLAHCAIYTVVVAAGLATVGYINGILDRIDWNWTFVIIFYTHFIIDLIKCRFRTKLYNGNEIDVDVNFDKSLNQDDRLYKKDIMAYLVDQCIHLVIIMAIYSSLF